jgi:hypothetical protein
MLVAGLRTRALRRWRIFQGPRSLQREVSAAIYGPLGIAAVEYEFEKSGASVTAAQNPFTGMPAMRPTGWGWGFLFAALAIAGTASDRISQGPHRRASRTLRPSDGHLPTDGGVTGRSAGKIPTE